MLKREAFISVSLDVLMSFRFSREQSLEVIGSTFQIRFTLRTPPIHCGHKLLDAKSLKDIVTSAFFYGVDPIFNRAVACQNPDWKISFQLTNHPQKL